MRVSVMQFVAMHQQSVQDFEQRLLLHLRESFADPLRHIGAEQLQAALRACLDRAHRYGIEMEDDVRRFAEFALTYGVSMDHDPNVAWIGTVLRMEHLSGSRRMDILDALEPRFLLATTS